MAQVPTEERVIIGMASVAVDDRALAEPSPLVSQLPPPPRAIRRGDPPPVKDPVPRLFLRSLLMVGAMICGWGITTTSAMNFIIGIPALLVGSALIAAVIFMPRSW